MDTRSTVSSGMWLEFFTNAGIPKSVSASYANKFAENRIKRDMIKDLTKDILRDMGVNCMGDVIAILRHAKEVYDEEILERVIGQSNSSVQTATVLPTKVPSGKKSSPSPRTQERHVRRTSSSAGGSPPHTSETQESPDLSDRIKNSSHRETKSSSRTGTIEKIYRKQTKANLPEDLAGYMARKRSVDRSSGGQSVRKADSSLAVKRKPVEDVPSAKKVRRVLPEHEGGYKITMPSGTTARTQEILKKKAILQADAKKSVFDRLGSGSEDEAIPAAVADTMFRVTGLDSVPFISSSSSSKSSSVFERLGDKSLQPTTSKTISIASVQNTIPHHGILKQPNNKAVFKRSTVVPSTSGTTSTMRADEEEQPAVKKKMTTVAPSITTVILPAMKTDSPRLVAGRGCTMRADEEVCMKVVGTSPVVKRLRTTLPQTVSVSATDKPVMRQIFRNRTTQGILAAPANHQKISVKARLGGGSTSHTGTQFSPEKKRVMFEKREVSFIGAPEKSGPTSQKARPFFYQKPVRTDRKGPSSFKNSVFHRLGQNRD